MDAASAFDSLTDTAKKRHDVATALLAWLREGDIDRLRHISEASGFQMLERGARLTWAREPDDAFDMVLLRDASDPQELADAVVASHAQGRLPTLIVQFSDDRTDTRGDNVFDVYASTSRLAIAHINRVYTRKA